MRYRGTALVFRDNKVLLVKDKDVNSYSLPGGGTHKDEPALAAAVRELYEELKMSAKKAERVFKCDYKGQSRYHKVTLIETEDEPIINDNELVEFIWWDMETDIKKFNHVDYIITKYLK